MSEPPRTRQRVHEPICTVPPFVSTWNDIRELRVWLIEPPACDSSRYVRFTTFGGKPTFEKPTPGSAWSILPWSMPSRHVLDVAWPRGILYRKEVDYEELWVDLCVKLRPMMTHELNLALHELVAIKRIVERHFMMLCFKTPEAAASVFAATQLLEPPVAALFGRTNGVTPIVRDELPLPTLRAPVSHVPPPPRSSQVTPARNALDHDDLFDPLSEVLGAMLDPKERSAFPIASTRMQHISKWWVDETTWVHVGTRPGLFACVIVSSPAQLEGLPRCVRHVRFTDDFDASLEGVSFPPLLSLTMGMLFDQPLDAVRFPKGIRVLGLGACYNRPLPALPDTLQRLELGTYFNQPLPQQWPRALQEVVVGHMYTHPEPTGVRFTRRTC